MKAKPLWMAKLPSPLDQVVVMVSMNQLELPRATMADAISADTAVWMPL